MKEKTIFINCRHWNKAKKGGVSRICLCNFCDKGNFSWDNHLVLYTKRPVFCRLSKLTDTILPTFFSILKLFVYITIAIIYFFFLVDKFEQRYQNCFD
jgi:hypothetical protein